MTGYRGGICGPGTQSGPGRYVQLAETYRDEPDVARHRDVTKLGRLEPAWEKLGRLIDGLCRVTTRGVPAAMTFERLPEVGGP